MKRLRRLFTRRALVAGLTLVGSGALGWTLRPRTMRLRPPGAAPGAEFARKCIRCLRCVAVCPRGAIRFDSSLDLASSDTPYIEAAERGCDLCMRCTEACPTGALGPTSSDLEQVAIAVRMGRPELDRDRCIAINGTGECRACFYVCPFAGRAVRLEGPLLEPRFDAGACVGCGLCEEACPERARAIRILPLPEDTA
jgi:ferredoxin-type protein NapG